jgi:N-methylhydantoinase A
MSRLAIDIGGTFTDLVYYDEKTQETTISKVSTTPKDQAEGVIQSIKKAGVDLIKCRFLIHGTTVVINAVLERKGARTALITTDGFKDVYIIGRVNRPDMYNLYYRKPEPFVPRSLTFQVPERINYKGEVLRPLVTDELGKIALELKHNKVSSVAVSLLHSYANPAHEEQVGIILKEFYPELHISLSSTIVREFREYERTSTTVINAYVMPIVDSYLRHLESVIASMGFTGDFLIMQSNGGVMTAEKAREIPVQVIESGPVAGVIGAAHLGSALGLKNIISFDMGGTTAKSSLIVDGQPKLWADYRIGGYNQGHPVKVPVVDIVEVGTGGGSVAWVDSGGSLKVGPKSAGAFPGPICYGMGGSEPTVTDANVLLGRINPNGFLGGEMNLDIESSRNGIKKLSDDLHLDENSTLAGIKTVADSNMSLSIRAVSVERGHDPRDFTMIAYGGGGPLHAIDLARELGIPRVVVPPNPAHFSAWGMLLADLRHDYVRTFVMRMDQMDLKELHGICNSLKELGYKALEGEGIASNKMEFQCSLDMRYLGQEHTVNVPISISEIENGKKVNVRERFDKLHEERYKHSAPQEIAEIVNLRVAAIGQVDKPKLKIHSLESASSKRAFRGRRKVYDTNINQFVESEIVAREGLKPGNIVEGPAVIEEYASNVVLSTGDISHVDEYGNLVVEVKSYE